MRGVDGEQIRGLGEEVRRPHGVDRAERFGRHAVAVVPGERRRRLS